MEQTEPAAAPRSRRLRRWLDSVKAIDFFEASGREDAERRISDLESVSHGDQTSTRERSGPQSRPTGRTWVTRRGIKVDRMASAWLIRRFIDPAATFKFVPAQGYRPEPGELRFDMFGGEFTHEGDRCTFETLLERFKLDDPALAALGQIVHDIDCKDERFDRAEVRGISALVDGVTRVHESDEDRLQRGAAMFDGLFQHFSAS
jgi:hypothetical protein